MKKEYEIRTYVIATLISCLVVFFDFWVPLPLNPTPIKALGLLILSSIVAFLYPNRSGGNVLLIASVPFGIDLIASMTHIFLESPLFIIGPIRWIIFTPALIVGAVLGLVIRRFNKN